MRSVTVALLLALTTLAGCVGNDAPTFARDDCAPSDPVATWVEPGLYAALPAAVDGADVLYAVNAGSSLPGLPFGHAPPDARWGDNFTLRGVQVRYSAEGVGHHGVIQLHNVAKWSNGTKVQLSVEASRSSGDPGPFARAALASFLENATAAPPAARGAFVEAAMEDAERHVAEDPDAGETYVSSLRVEAGLFEPLRLGALYDNLTANATPAVDASSNGATVRLAGAGGLTGWEWRFTYPARTVAFNETGRADPAPGQFMKPFLQVGPTGAAHLSIPAPVAADAAATQAWVADAFGELGLAQPTFQEWWFRPPGASHHCPAGVVG